MSLQDKVRLLRTNRGYNQQQLAQKAGVTPATISRIESGKTKQLKSLALSRLAAALNVSTDILIESTKQKQIFDPVNYDPALNGLANIYRDLVPLKRKHLLSYALYLANDNNIIKNKHNELFEYMKG